MYNKFDDYNHTIYQINQEVTTKMENTKDNIGNTDFIKEFKLLKKAKMKKKLIYIRNCYLHNTNLCFRSVSYT